MNGDRLTQPEFHRRYEAYPDNTKFELIGGTVHMTSPLPPRPLRLRWQGHAAYCNFTRSPPPASRTVHNATTILDDESEPQPDVGLRA